MDVIVALTLPLPELRFIWKAMNGHVTRPPAASCTLPTLVHDVGSAPPLPMPTYAVAFSPHLTTMRNHPCPSPAPATVTVVAGLPLLLNAATYWGVGFTLAWHGAQRPAAAASDIWLGIVAALWVVAALLITRFVRLTARMQVEAGAACG